MVHIILEVLKESYILFNEMAAYLLLGFLFAGIIHVYLTTESISKYAGQGNLKSVLLTTLIGIPLPICSCGVIPTAVSLKKEGASQGSIISFLIATPTSGVDSILSTYSLLGPIFAVYRVIISFITGIMSGIFANIFLKAEETESKRENANNFCNTCNISGCEGNHIFIEKIISIFRYAFGELLDGIKTWLVIGIIVGGTISYFIPASFIERYIGQGWLSMFIMLIVGIPLYVCATGSIPIAAALMYKGLNPGAALVFLLAGPATNAVTITVLGKELGKKALTLYLISISVFSIIFGMLLNKIWPYFNISIREIHHHSGILPKWFLTIASIILLFLLMVSYIRFLINKFSKKSIKEPANMVVIDVEGMSCQHCVNTIKNGLFDKFGLKEVQIDLDEGKVYINNENNYDIEMIKATINKLGYTV